MLIDRGYTSHKHLWEAGIIHMNGRLYDPLLRRFLNADEYIQDPHNTQNYNKYGYVYNNPLLYNDPSGEVIGLLVGAVIGAVVGLVSYTVGLAVTGNLYQWNLGGALKATFWGAVSGAVSFGVGEIFSTAGGVLKGAQELTKIGKAIKDAVGGVGLAVVRAGTHAVSQGILAAVQGVDVVSAMAGSFFGSLGAEAWGGAMNGLGYEKFANSTVGVVAFGALSGGIGAELSGGNFWQGAVTGGIVAGLNHAMHKMATKYQIKNSLRDEFQGTGMNPDSQASFENHAELTENLPSLKNIADKIRQKAQLNFEENNNIRSKGLVSPNSPNNVQINATKLSTMIEYAYTLGHEMIHVFDLVYNTKMMFNILGRDHRDVRDYYMEIRAYQWEINNGNSNANKILNYFKKNSNPAIRNYLDSKINRLNGAMINP